MTKLKSSESARASGDRAALGRLFVLDISGNRVLSLNPDGSDRKVIVTECRLPDGIAVDVEGGHIYWTNMGVPTQNDGSIERVDLDGRNRTTIVPQGGTFTPKQLKLEKKSGKLYWCDREGMRVMRANLDGSALETLVETSQGDPRPGRDQTKWCVGHRRGCGSQADLLDAKRPGQRGTGSHLPRRHRNSRRAERRPIAQDIEVLFDGLPEPIDLELDLEQSPPVLDRPRRPAARQHGQPRPDGRGIQGARPAPEIVFTHLMEGIGIALDLKGGRMFLTDLAGSVYSASLDGSGKQTLLYAQGNLTGIAYVEFPQRRTNHVLRQTNSPDRHRRHRGHRRELGRPVSGARLRRGRDRPRPERGSQPAQVRGRGVGGTRRHWPFAGRSRATACPSRRT